MVIEIINKVLTILFVLSLTNIVRHLFFTVLAWTKKIDENGKYILTERGLLFLGLSIAYVITGIITGINL